MFVVVYDWCFFVDCGCIGGGWGVGWWVYYVYDDFVGGVVGCIGGVCYFWLVSLVNGLL